ncbi:hypothetical protein PHSY_002116 [Pseudozyma hubeiensis SY62]|uniref:Uncharacterized protein n=1 Tax=Pseudozyma hubeiensis (strain SY62) TaxID=1305764 RepID=R9P0C7_PSEHS|nr:hypothetical protein PHSY_002116 [Pseudozyma hubeiensis SY62]GAC94544.1 hypothetical protein PHSY_002116 [Pseudozyma hubeiensis SY62]
MAIQTPLADLSARPRPCEWQEQQEHPPFDEHDDQLAEAKSPLLRASKGQFRAATLRWTTSDTGNRIRSRLSNGDRAVHCRRATEFS